MLLGSAEQPSDKVLIVYLMISIESLQRIMNTSIQSHLAAYSILFWSSVILACTLFISTPKTRADSVQIQNVIQTRTSTGDNTVSDGKTITTGRSSNSVSVNMVANGENVEDYYASSTDPINYSSSYTTENGGGVTQGNTQDRNLLKAQENLRHLRETQSIQAKIQPEVDKQAKNVHKNKTTGTQVALAAQNNPGSVSSSSTSENKTDAMASGRTIHGLKTLLSNIFAYVRIWISQYESSK